jgi:hypothetical protein
LKPKKRVINKNLNKLFIKLKYMQWNLQVLSPPEAPPPNPPPPPNPLLNIHGLIIN